MRVRPSARGIVFNDLGEVVLLRCEDTRPADPRHPDLLRYWVTPGGGTKAHETPEQSLARELHEETGLTNVEIGPCVWVRELELKLPKLGPVLCHERYFVCHSKQTDTTRANLTANEHGIVKEVRWWPLHQLTGSAEIFRPPDFVALVQYLASGERPAEPIRIA